ncbi:hypothetical protein RFI_39842, partial [Reticulomyxa filosa]
SPFKHEREILFARSLINPSKDEKTHKEQYAWNAKVESEDEYTQMILLTWVRYDQYIQQTMQISVRWDHKINLNLIHIALNGHNGDINETIKLLFKFEQWKFQNNNKQQYKKKANKFLKKRCCDHDINLFSIFIVKENAIKFTSIEHALLCTVHNCLPFVKKDNKKKNSNK